MRIKIPEKLGWVFEGQARYRGAYGGRGSAKSQTFCTMALLRGMESPKKILCGRELQNSIKDSVHAEMCSIIDDLKLGGFYEYGENFIRGATGTEVIYRGLRHNYQSIKSISGIDICLLEEAEYISEQSYKYLIPTIRKPGSEIWPIWNPERVDSPTKKRFVDNPPPNARIVQMNWRDNPWFPKELEDERQRDMERDPDGAMHIWEGECATRTDAQVYGGKWSIRDFIPNEQWDGPYFGADWGFSQDPTVLVKCWVYNKCLYIEYEAFGYQTELDDIPALFKTIPDSQRYKIFADCARPETISHVKSRGFIIEGAEKWTGSVEDGVEFIRGGFDKIIVHTRCSRTANEMRLYSHKIDRLTNEILVDIVDKHNHAQDSIRYAIGKMIKRRPRGFFS